MSREDEIYNALRRIEGKMDDHITSSNDWRTKTDSDIREIKTHSGYTKKTTDKHEERIKVLEDSKSKMTGAMWTFGIVWTGILALYVLIKDFIHKAVE